MRYISLRDIRKTLDFNGDFADTNQKSIAIDKLEDCFKNGTVELGSQKYTLAETVGFLKSINTQNQLFFEWIDQHESLRNLLFNNIQSKRFSDEYKWKEHQLYSEFKRVLSPYLCSVALNNKTATLQVKEVVFSFLILLSADDRMVVEQELFQDIRLQIQETVENAKHVTKEIELLEMAQSIANDKITHIINDLSRTSYATKIWYVDQLLLVIQQQGCTIRLANWILKQLEQIALNPEHQTKILALKTDLRLGKIRVKNSNIKKQKGLPKKLIFSIFFFGFLLSTIGWIIWAKPFSTNEAPLFNTGTSFEQFSKSERKKIDSLLRQIQKNRPSETNQIDLNQSILGNGVSLEIRSPFANQHMEHLYQDLIKDADLQEKGVLDSCNAFSKKEANTQFYQRVKDAEKQKAAIDLFFKNESGYSVYLIAFENNHSGKIFSHFIEKGTTVILQFNEFDQLFFLPGNDLGPFIAPKNSTNLPSKEFTHHFCSVDYNYIQSLNTIYSLSRPQYGNNKLLFTGDKSSYFTVVDLYGILEVL